MQTLEESKIFTAETFERNKSEFQKSGLTVEDDKKSVYSERPKINVKIII